MNAIAEVSTRLPMPQGMASDFDLRKWRVLCETTFPSAKTPEAIVMALDYCRARGLDVFKRPVHIVPMWNSTLKREVETVWAGINEIQTTAARTGAWAGMDAPEWGPDKEQTFKGRRKDKESGGWKDVAAGVVYPEWCAVTVYRMVNGQRCPFSEPVYWLEAYSRSFGAELPTDMWIKRPRGQLHKVAKSASLRAAFPEEGEYTAEEMEGKEIEAGGVVIEHEAPAKPVKRTMVEISANKKRREDECAAVQKDLSQIETLSELQRYEAEHLTPQFMGSLGNAQFAVEEWLEQRRNELSEPAADEETEAPSKSAYIRGCHRAIDAFESAADLLAWWNSAAEKQARRNYDLNKAEVQQLMVRVFERRASLSAPEASPERLAGDPTSTTAEPEERAGEAPTPAESDIGASEAWRAELLELLANAKTVRAIDTIENTRVGPESKTYFPGDVGDVERAIERARKRVSKA